MEKLTLVNVGIKLSFLQELRNTELKHIEKVFYESNSYPKYVVKQVLQQISEEHNQATNGTDNSNNNIDDGNISSMKWISDTWFVIPYQGKKRDRVLKFFEKGMRKMLPNNVKPRIAFTGRNVGRSF